jgi:hypothetical protein
MRVKTFLPFRIARFNITRLYSWLVGYCVVVYEQCTGGPDSQPRMWGSAVIWMQRSLGCALGTFNTTYKEWVTLTSGFRLPSSVVGYKLQNGTDLLVQEIMTWCEWRNHTPRLQYLSSELQLNLQIIRPDVISVWHRDQLHVTRYHPNHHCNAYFSFVAQHECIRGIRGW